MHRVQEAPRIVKQAPYAKTADYDLSTRRAIVEQGSVLTICVQLGSSPRWQNFDLYVLRKGDQTFSAAVWFDDGYDSEFTLEFAAVNTEDQWAVTNTDFVGAQFKFVCPS